MTAEVCVMNRMGVALAADSAITIGDGKKIHTSANKMFLLTENDPVGVMIFGMISLVGVPWETIITAYRKETNTHRLATVADYADDFVLFLKKNIALFTEDKQHEALRWMAEDFFRWVRQDIYTALDKRLLKHKKRTDVQVDRFVEVVISRRRSKIQKTKLQDGLSADICEKLMNAYGDEIREISDKVLGKFADNSRKELVELFLDFVTYQYDNLSRTGVIFVGFGSKEYFPAITELSFQTVLVDELLYHQKKTISMSDAKQSGYVLPFAQQEMVHAFMHGIDPTFRKLISTTTDNAVLSLYRQIRSDSATKPEMYAYLKRFETPVRQALKDLEQRLDEREKEKFKNPVITAIANLPKSELAAAAEMMVMLTKFKRKLSADQLETVGGPIDVAVITKGDGFIWIKRKNYFDAALNPRFVARYGQVEKWTKNHDDPLTR